MYSSPSAVKHFSLVQDQQSPKSEDPKAPTLSKYDDHEASVFLTSSKTQVHKSTREISKTNNTAEEEIYICTHLTTHLCPTHNTVKSNRNRKVLGRGPLGEWRGDGCVER